MQDFIHLQEETPELVDFIPSSLALNWIIDGTPLFIREWRLKEV